MEGETMNRYCLCVLILLTFQAAGSRAEVFERDWKTPGDRLLTYDDVGQREWLDLSVSLLTQFPGANIEDRYQNALAELEPNGQFFGFAVAQAIDVIQLAESSGINTMTSDFQINQLATNQLIDKLGVTTESTDGVFRASVGYLDEISPPPPPGLRLAAEFRVFFGSGFDAGLSLSGGSDSIRQTTTGIMLYRAVPEPSAFLMLISTAISISSMQRNRRPAGAFRFCAASASIALLALS
jgi:hypothetical protein